VAMGEEPLSVSTTSTISDIGTSSDTSASFQKPHRSAVWKHFRRERRSAQCLLCKKILSYNGGMTSNLLQHLSSKHPSSVQAHKDKCLAENAMTKQLSMKQCNKLHKGKLVSKPCTVETQEGITSLGPGLCLYALNLGEANSIVLD